MRCRTLIPLLVLAACSGGSDDEYCVTIDFADGRSWKKCDEKQNLIDPLMKPIEPAIAPTLNDKPVVEAERLINETNYQLRTAAGLELKAGVIENIIALDTTMARHATYNVDEDGRLSVMNDRGVRVFTIKPALPEIQQQRLLGRLLFETAYDPDIWPFGGESSGVWSGAGHITGGSGGSGSGSGSGGGGGTNPLCPVACSSDAQCGAGQACRACPGGCPNHCQPSGGGGKMCTSAADCNDNNACTTDECTQVGFCANTFKNCDDGMSCTTDSCDPATGMCKNDAKQCDKGTECTDGAVCDPTTGECPPPQNCEKCGPPITTNLGLGSFKLPPIGFSVPCGPFGAIAFNGEAEVTGGRELVSCPTCTDKLWGKITGKGTAEFCGVKAEACRGYGNGMEGFNFEGSGSKTEEKCARCNDAICKEECQELKQITKEGALKGEVCFRGFIPGLYLGGQPRVGPFSADLICGAQAKATFGAGGSINFKENHGTKPDCQGEDCKQLTGELNAGAEISGGCVIKACFRSWCTPNFEISNIVYGKIGASGKLTKQWGKCGDKLCLGGSVSVEAGAAPSVTVGWRRWQYCLKAQAAVKVECSADGCADKFECKHTPILKLGMCD